MAGNVDTIARDLNANNIRRQKKLAAKKSQKSAHRVNFELFRNKRMGPEDAAKAMPLQQKGEVHLFSVKGWLKGDLIWDLDCVEMSQLEKEFPHMIHWAIRAPHGALLKANGNVGIEGEFWFRRVA